MTRNPESLSASQFDLVVIGGGITGAAAAREAALRGLHVALLDARDFAGGTSSRSSKLIHGGLRYLAQGDFTLVREARRERRLLLKLAPHLAQPLPFLLPIYQGDRYSPLKVRLGLSLYDLLGNLGPRDRYRVYGPKRTLQQVPALRAEGLRAGAVYHDSQTDDARLSFENALDAAEHGAVVVNYLKLRTFKKKAGGLSLASAEAEDRLAGRRYEISGRFWINATGPWVDDVRALVPDYDGSKTIRTTKGTHVILPSVCERYAILAAILPGERIFLMMPWHGCSLLGTTDTDYEGDGDAVEPDTTDVEYLIRAVNRVLRATLQRECVMGSFAGLRALVLEEGRSPSANTREYRFHRDPWAKNMITVCGGKLTTARALSEKLIDLVAAELPSRAGSEVYSNPSRHVPLPGGHIAGPWAAFVESAKEEAIKQFGIPLRVAERLVRTYGSRWRKVLEPVRHDKTLANPLPGAASLLAAEVVFSIREEMGVMIEDFLLRRSGLNWMACAYPELASTVADLFARELGWSPGIRQAALQHYQRLACACGAAKAS